RRELRAAATAAERAAAEAASAQSRAKNEIEALRSRLDSAVTRLQSLEQAKRLERARGAGDLEAGQTELLRAQAAAAVLRQELSAARESARSSMELALRDGPPPPAAPLLPALEACLSAWEERFRRADVEVAREWSVPLPDAPHEPKAFVVVLRHVLRNVLESVPRGGRLTVRALRGRDGGLRVEFADDGPGFPAGWLARPFQAGASGESVRAGLGLRLVRLALRRWGGNVEAFNAVSGRGARLVLSFAPPSA
ncbi:MAG: sensor histidine kinase, partial [Elusimicrobia bacterium]|nr:sensor histidine kinase [Elusimicrobiota bacterium]